MFHAWLLVFSLEERIQPDPCGETAVILSVPAVIILTFPALLIPAPEFPASFQILGSETFNLRSLVDVPRSSCQKDKNTARRQSEGKTASRRPPVSGNVISGARVQRRPRGISSSQYLFL